MGVKHTKPCGAYADVKELEYISALHQTGKNELRKDGSIHAIDIVHFLMSRYGIKVTEEEVKDRILSAFGEYSSRSGSDRYDSETIETVGDSGNTFNGDGGCIQEEEEGGEGCLDLTQVQALLLVPLLLKVQRSLMQQTSNLHSNSQTPSPPKQTGNKTTPEMYNDATTTLGTTALDNFNSHLESPLLQSSPRFLEVQHHSDKGEKRWPDADLIENVLRMMLHDATGDPNPRPLSKELIRQLLSFYGERELADDDGLLDEMVMAASANENASNVSADSVPADVEGEPILLDQYAFARALTHDVQQYDIDNENRVTTNYYDVFQTHYSTKTNEKKKWISRLVNPMKTVEVDGDTRPVERVYTFPSIDYTADTFRSKGFVILLWVTWIMTYYSYLANSDVLTLARLSCNPPHDSAEIPTFGCAMLQGITNWLIIMLQLSILGTTFVTWASVGNSVYPTNPVWIVVGMAAVVLFVLLPYFQEVDSEAFSTKKEEDARSRLLYHFSVIGGFLLLVASSLHLAQRLFLRKLFEKFKLAKFFTPSLIRREAETKQAASCKVNQLVRNACEVHKKAELDGAIINDAGETKYGMAMLAFTKTSDETEEFGGFLQIWRRILNGELFNDDGIWFTTHLLAGNAAQCTICFILATSFIVFYNSDTFQEGLKYLDTIAPITQVPQRWRLMIPLFFGFIWGEITVIVITASYLPSTVRTILQYRSGGHGSLQDTKFLKLRCAVDQSSLLFGSVFWGTLYTSIITGFFAMLVLGVCLWPDFAAVVLSIFGNLTGIGITMLLKWIALIGFRRKHAKAFYRKSVGLTNFVGVILESWNLGLTTGYMLIRSFKLVIAATLYIGRVDVPFLSEYACFLGPFELDAYPLIFKKDLLVHEAHRHPYLERIGVMYMLKLHHDRFGNSAGTCWRLLFVHALMPWMRKYRRSDDSFDVSDFKFAANRMWTGRIPPQYKPKEESDALASLRELDVSKENNSGDTGDLIEVLKQQNEILKKENEMMRSLLFQHTSGEERLSSSCPPKMFSK